jgi:hypothetical protein
MDLNLYTEEFRDFKYLKSSHELVKRFKAARINRNRVQGWHDTPNPTHEWPHAVEFAEQVLDLKDDNLYIVFAGALSSKNEYEEANLITVENPVIIDSNPIIYDQWKEATIDDVYWIQDDINAHPCMVERKSIADGIFIADSRIIRLNSLPLAPKEMADFTAMFYDKDTAEKYRKTLTEMLRYKINAISSFTARL